MNGMQFVEQYHPTEDTKEGFCLLLSPGHPILLQVSSDQRACRATVLGLKPGEFIIVKPPASLFGRATPPPDVPVRVRLEENGTVYGFDAAVLSILKHPSPLLFLAYPKSFEVHILRRHPRIKCLVPTMVESGSFECQGHLCDISMGGCKIVAPANEARKGGRVEHGDQMVVCLPTSGLRMEKLSGQVCAFKEENGILNFGLAFQENEQTSAVIARFIENLKLLESMREQVSKEASAEAQDLPASFDRSSAATACVNDGSLVSLKVHELIEIQFTGNHLYDQSTILGVDGTDSVIAEMPLSCGIKNHPKPGMGLRVRFEAHGSRYGFRTSVTKFITKPRPLVFFAYPKKIEILMRRKNFRVRCQLPVKLANEHFSTTGYIADISLGGCRVLVNMENQDLICNIMTGDRMDVTLPLEGLHVEKLRAQVQNYWHSGKTLTLGLIFSLDKKQSQQLSGFMSRMEAASH